MNRQEIVLASLASFAIFAAITPSRGQEFTGAASQAPVLAQAAELSDSVSDASAKKTAADLPENGAIQSDSDQKPKSTDPRFRILNGSGEPVNGARVRLIHQTQTYRELVEHRLLYETKTDQDGYFRLPPGKQVANAQDEDNGFSATWVSVTAHEGKPKRTWLLGTSTGAYSPFMEFVYAMATKPETLQNLQKGLGVAKDIPTSYSLPDRETTIRVVNHDGSPAAGVGVTPIRVVWLWKGNAMRPIFVPPQLRESMRRWTDVDGKVTFKTIAPMEFAELEFQSPQHGVQRTFTNANSVGDVLDRDLMLFPTGTIVGTVKATKAADQAFLKSSRLLFKSQVQNSGLRYPKNMAIPMHGYAEVTVDEQGRFEIPAMLNGRLTLYDRLGENAATRISFPSRLIVKPGQTTNVEGHVISTVFVHGVLKKRDTGEPVASAAMSIRHGKQSGLSRELTVHSRTDENGRFEARVFPGMIGYSPITVVPGHVPVYKWEQPQVATTRIPSLPYGQRAIVPADVGEFTLSPLELVPSMTLTGRLIDADGQPVPNRGVYAFPVAGRTNCDFAQTNSDGEFTMKRIPSTHPPKFFKAGKQYKTKPAKIVSQEPLVLQVRVD